MKIDINKDFEEAFPNEVYSGFTLGQCMAAASGMVLAFGAAFLLWRFAGIPIVECTYLAIPLMVPVCAVGFFKYQGQSLTGIIREMMYSRRTEKLAYSAGEYRPGSGRVFTAGRVPGKDSGNREDRKKQKEKRKQHKEDLKKKREKQKEDQRENRKKQKENRKIEMMKAKKEKRNAKKKKRKEKKGGSDHGSL